MPDFADFVEKGDEKPASFASDDNFAAGLLKTGSPKCYMNMKNYFVLQFRRIERKLTEAGIHPVPGILLAGVAFVAISAYLFSRTAAADWIYALLGFFVILKLGDANRNDLLRSIFKRKDYYLIRVQENIITALPFILYLVYERTYLMATGLFLISIPLAAINTRQLWRFTIPTPFRKFPFEFIAGTRKAFWLILAACFLTLKSIQVENFNLGVFSLALLFFITLSYYFKPERAYFVWIYSANAKGFLRKKISTALICSSILTIPVLVMLCMVFPENIPIITGVQMAGYIFLISMVLAKYSAFPYEMNIPQAVLYSLCLWFPPALLIVIPIFFVQAQKRLNPILE